MSVGEGRRSGAYRPGRGLAVPEYRDPSAATRNIRWQASGQPQVADWNATRALQLGYLANVVAYRCITVIADTIAARKFRAGAVAPERPGDTADHNPDSRLAQLLGPPPGGPNVQWSAREQFAWSIAQKLATGRYAWEIETTGPRGQGDVVALWPLVVTNLDPIPSSSGSRYFSGFKYGRPDEKVDLVPDQVHYGWKKSQTDVRQPFSPLQVARYALSIALAHDQHQYAFLKNGAVPAYIVGIEAFPDTPEGTADFEAFKRQWHSEYDGPENGGKAHIMELVPNGDGKLSEALFIQTVGTSAKDGRLPEVYLQALQQVAIALGVPWSKLDASGRTFDNASEEDRTFWESTLLDVAADFEDDVNRSIAPRVGGEVGWFDLSDVAALQPKVPASASEIPGLIAAGVIDPVEARPWLGLTGPAPVVLPALPPATTTEEVEDGTPPALPGGADPASDRAGGRGAQAQEEARRQEEVETRATVDQEARRGAIWRSTDAVITAQERQWQRSWSRLFAKQERATLARLEGNARSKRWAAIAEARAVPEVRAQGEGLFDPGFWLGESEELATGLFETLTGQAFARLSSSFGVSFDLEAEFAQLFITSRSNQLAGQVTQTTYGQITDALAEGVGEGEGIPALADRIRAVFAEARGNRAEMIARTEVVSGFNASALAAASSLPADVVAGQQWIATRDSRTRASHAAADGQIVAVGQAFSVGGSGAAYPGDPQLPADETVNCRCTVAFLTPEEFTAEATLYAESQAAVPVPVSRARVALALVAPGEFDESRFRKALVAA